MENSTCKVVMNGEEHESNDFITLLHREDGSASMFYQTDALSLGLGIKALAGTFVDLMSKCTEQEKQEIQEILGDAFFTDGVLPNA